MAMPKFEYRPDIEILGRVDDSFAQILSYPALAFIADLHQHFDTRRVELLQRRETCQRKIDRGCRPDFLEETAHIRRNEWRVAPTPEDLLDRRVEITGPVDRKMVINGLNSGAKVFMADFEDAHAPTWDATIQGQINLRDAVLGDLEYTSPGGRHYRLNEQVATLMMRPRGWHLEERHVLIDGERVSASLFDFGLYLFHNAHRLLENGSGPYFYLPKLESRLEARLWDDVFDFSERALGLPHGSIKCTVLIETIMAAFEMDEILFELRDHVVGLNCGRWDYIFSFIKRFRQDADMVLPDRFDVTMDSHCMRAYSRLLIKTCHRRGVHAIGGMAAQIPIRDKPAADAAARERVREDKEREASDGHDGTWVAHPGLVPVAMSMFDQHMPGPNQLDRTLGEVSISASDLLTVPQGRITAQGVRRNISAALRYIAEWLSGHGAVAIHHLMEDASTAEIARAQLWQWVRHPKGELSDGRPITLDLFRQFLVEEIEAVRSEVGESEFRNRKYPAATTLLQQLVEGDEFPEFFTLQACEMLTK